MKLREEKKTLKKINKKNLPLHFVPNQPKEKNEMKEKKIPQKIKKELNSTSRLLLIRIEICRDRHDQRFCKICASCCARTSRFTHTKCDFALKLLKLYTHS